MVFQVDHIGIDPNFYVLQGTSTTPESDAVFDLENYRVINEAL
jgi:S-ribosylhomocysteine lyase LuxS involved in autoinducer biosynthesis